MSGRENDIAWVDVADDGAATGDLKAAYDAVRGSDGKVENLYLAKSQTPVAIKPADDHYLALLHNPDNPLAPWLSELVATFVAILCKCDYATLNHGKNFRMYLTDDVLAEHWLSALRTGCWTDVLEGEVLAALRFTEKLSTQPSEMGRADIVALRDAGF